MRVSDVEFRGYAAAAMIGIVTAKGAGDAKAVAKQAIAMAKELRKELANIPEEDDHHYGQKGDNASGKDRTD